MIQPSENTPSPVLGSLRPRRGWGLAVYLDAREAGGSFRASLPVSGGGRVGVPGEAVDPARSAAEAARRARSKCRRYCAANRLNRLGTLTYAGTGCHDPLVVRADVAAFWRELRRELGGRSFAYLWVPEWHPGGHGLHVHFAVGRFIKVSLIREVWGRGHVHITQINGLPVGSGVIAEARKASAYLAKYVGKSFDTQTMAGLHRYEVAEGFQPRMTPVWAPSQSEAIRAASRLVGGAQPERVWRSSQEAEWLGPPAVWVQWPG